MAGGAVAVAPVSTTDALMSFIDPRRWLETAGGRTIPILVAMAVIWIYFEIATHGLFFTPGNVTNILTVASLYGIVAIGEVVVLLLGEIDLSLGSLVGASGCAACAAMVEPMNWNILGVSIHLGFIQGAAPVPQMLMGAGVAILFGVVAGTVLGFAVAYLHIPSFVVTLSGLLGFYGLALVITNAQTIPVTNQYYESLGSSGTEFNHGYLPTILGSGTDFFHLSIGMIIAAVGGLLYTLTLVSGDVAKRRQGLSGRSASWPIAQGLILTLVAVAICWSLDRDQGVQLPFLVFVAFLVVFSYLAKRTSFGRHIYATGGNAEAARRAGIAIRRVRMSAFIISGFCAGTVGVLFFAYFGSANGGEPDPSFLLLCIASAVIGGTSLFGGRGSIWAALTGAVMLSSVQTGMGLTLASNTNGEYYEWIVQALILFAAVWLDTSIRRRSTVGRRT